MTEFLGRRKATAYLAEKGLPLTKTSLEKMATLGGGPVYRKFGGRVIYTPEDLDSWVASKLSQPRVSSSAAD